MFFPFPFICLYLIPNSKFNLNVPFVMEFFPNKSTFCFTYFELSVVDEYNNRIMAIVITANIVLIVHQASSSLYYMYGLVQLMLTISMPCKSYDYNILLRHEIRDMERLDKLLEITHLVGDELSMQNSGILISESVFCLTASFITT